MNELRICICGKELEPPKLYCSDRCRWIAKKMETPFGQRMDNVARAVRFFGKQWDKKHGKSSTGAN